jgi:hypothetical protein
MLDGLRCASEGWLPPAALIIVTTFAWPLH